MARMEKKSVTCRPFEENSTIQKYESFGWTLDSSQEVFNKDSHVEGRYGGNVSVTETTNYVKLLFSRDKDMPYYEKIVELENQYDLVKVEEPSKSGKGCSSAIAALYGWPLAIIGTILFFSLKEPGFLIMTAIGIIVLVFRFKTHGSYNDAVTKANEEFQKKQRDILEEVKKYV